MHPGGGCRRYSRLRGRSSRLAPPAGELCIPEEPSRLLINAGGTRIPLLPRPRPGMVYTTSRATQACRALCGRPVWAHAASNNPDARWITLEHSRLNDAAEHGRPEASDPGVGAVTALHRGPARGGSAPRGFSSLVPPGQFLRCDRTDDGNPQDRSCGSRAAARRRRYRGPYHGAIGRAYGRDRGGSPCRRASTVTLPWAGHVRLRLNRAR